MAKRYTTITLRNFSGGRQDTARHRDIDPDASTSDLNIDYSEDGSFQVRSLRSVRIGSDDENKGAILGLSSICSAENCAIQGSDDQECDCDGDCDNADYVINPKPTGDTFLVKSYIGDNCKTKIAYLNNITNTWEDKDEINGIHPHDFVPYMSRLYYSNGIHDLKFMCFRKKDDDDACTVRIDDHYPTCRTAYDIGTQPPTVIEAVQSNLTGTGQTAGVITFGRPLVDCNDNWKDLCDYIKDNPRFLEEEEEVPDPTPDDPLNTKTVTVYVDNPDKASIKLNVCSAGSGCGEDGGMIEYELTDIEVRSCCDRQIFWYDPPIIEGQLPPVGTHRKICIEYDGGKKYCPVYCCHSDGDGNEVRLAEGIKGYILRLHKQRLFIGGNISDGLIDTVWYSATAISIDNQHDLPRSIGDFTDRGKFKEAGNAGYFGVDFSCNEITAITNVGNDLYTARSGSDPALYKILDSDGIFVPAVVHNSIAPNWFRNTISSNGLNYHIAYNGKSPSINAHGIFRGDLHASTRLVSSNIQQTLSRIDFTHGAMVSWGGFILMAGKSIDTCEEELPQLCGTAEDDFTGNNVVLAYNTLTRAYSVWNGWNVNVWHKVGNRLFFGDSSNGNVFEVKRGLRDNAILTDKGVDESVSDGITSYWKSKTLDFNESGKSFKLSAVTFYGSIDNDTADLELGVSLNGGHPITISHSFEATSNKNCSGDNCTVNRLQRKGENKIKEFSVILDASTYNDVDLFFEDIALEVKRKSGWWRISKISIEIEAITAEESRTRSRRIRDNVPKC